MTEAVAPGSGSIHWLYQACTPGQYCDAAHAVMLSAEPVVGGWSAVALVSSFQVLPKSGDT